MAIRQLRLFDDEILRKKSRPVERLDERTLRLLNDMAETMYSTRIGAGLAACQVGVLRRLVVIDMGDGLLKLVNPRIVQAEGEQECVEGCLSFPNVWGKLMRPKKVTVEAMDEHGKIRLITGEGDFAKCLCHELDHLDGGVFTDKMIERVSL